MSVLLMLFATIASWRTCHCVRAGVFAHAHLGVCAAHIGTVEGRKSRKAVTEMLNDLAGVLSRYRPTGGGTVAIPTTAGMLVVSYDQVEPEDAIDAYIRSREGVELLDALVVSGVRVRRYGSDEPLRIAPVPA